MAAIFVLATVLVCALAAPLNLFLLNDTETNGAICLDGTPAGLLIIFLPHLVGYYFQPGSGSGANSWMIFFQGGGLHFNFSLLLTSRLVLY